MAMHCDVLVAGGGPAGACIATLLALRGKCVAMIDPATAAVDRLEVLPPCAGPAIAALDLASVLDDSAIARRCLGIRRRWGPVEDVDDFFAHRGGIGYVVDRARFDAKLRARALQLGVRFVKGRIVSARRERGTIVVGVAGGAVKSTVTANVAVDATGRPAALARRLGARRWLSERMIAERQGCGLDRGSDSDQPSWLEVQGGEGDWSYRINGPQGRVEVWTLHRTGRLRPPHSKVLNASAACLVSAAGEGWLAIGDAATSYDPITSQGMVNALTTSIVGAGAILSSDGLHADQAACYSSAIAATFWNSEAGRASVYATLPMKAQDEDGSRSRSRKPPIAAALVRPSVAR